MNDTPDELYKCLTTNTKNFVLTRLFYNIGEFLGYCNPQHSEMPDKDLLLNISSVVFIFHSKHIDDGYILIFPRDMVNSSIVEINVFTPLYYERILTDFQKISYMDNNLVCFISTTRKIIYNTATSNLYIEGSPNDRFTAFFRLIGNLEVSASLRVYATDQFMPICMLGREINKECRGGKLRCSLESKKQKLYHDVAIAPRYISVLSKGLDLLKVLLANSDRETASLLTDKVVYETGISPDDMRNFDEKVLKLSWGTRANYETPLQDFHKNYCVIFQMENAFLAVISYDKVDKPFQGRYSANYGMLIFMNEYCYYAGRFSAATHFEVWKKSPTSSSYSLSEVCPVKALSPSCSLFTFKNCSYEIHGDFKNTCNNPLLMDDRPIGKCKVHYFVNVPGALQYFDNSLDSLKDQFI